MASRNSSSVALFFALNILFFTLTVATDCGCSPSPKPKPVPSPKPPKHVPSPSVPSPSVPSPSVPHPNPRPATPPRTPGSSGNCPIDALKLGVCGNVLSGLLNIQLGQPSAQRCCSVIKVWLTSRLRFVSALLLGLTFLGSTLTFLYLSAFFSTSVTRRFRLVLNALESAMHTAYDAHTVSSAKYLSLNKCIQATV
ncbi:unnamed protein product [Brassica napus]|uniref:(rape) hypothetical protein n=1 Tax=Brassica napus TaxID=3708 RepID=A0A816J865_BRANA|nr:unnamed protein product [Brassica napus]